VPWVKLDDQFYVNRKAVAAGLEGRALFLASLCYCAMQLNDGHLTAQDLPVIAAMAGVEPSVADRLVSVALWKPTELGWDVHEYLDSNPSREQVLADRQAATERQRRSRSRRASRRDFARSSASPSPSPDKENTPSSSGNSRGPDQPVDDDVLAEVPDEVWIHYANLMLAKQPAGTVKQPVAWNRRTKENAKLELGDKAARWWDMFRVTPRHLAECLIDGHPPRNAPRRETT